MAAIRLTYEDGTIRAAGPGADALPGVEADPRSGDYRGPAHRYREIAAAARERASADGGAPDAVEDRVLRTPAVGDLSTEYVLREYQREALDAWLDADRRGVLELPTGSGKTVIALAAIAAVDAATLVVVPTIDLQEQWLEELRAEFDVPVGRFGGGQQRREPITVSTYDSAYRRADGIGDRFELVVFDEVHHLGAEGYQEIARLLAAPYRLGLTATFERPDRGHEAVADLVGPRVYALDPEDLAGDHLAPYDVKRVAVELTDEERREYEDAQGTFADYLARSGIDLQRGSDYQELVKRSGYDDDAREALLARQRARQIAYGCVGKLDALADILERHRGERTIVFTAHNDLAYEVSERFLVPVLTHQTPADERRELLDRFREGTYTRIATSNVLDEGVDVPDASVAVVLSGSGSQREFTQRLGRVLRPSEERERAVLYEVVAEDTSEARTADRRRD